ncbi:hypothetical protein C8F04DRAFT_1187126 [Mycena alexandri]|uniref:Uncharacterized protein n=1 Tax=Mycena alexandri TaxID=1745969 RepID=A0AAD6SN18_9AGAR|nr:hypothetical protein C8F04DRAFT_1187126 [Mycena alexandri]
MQRAPHRHFPDEEALAEDFPLWVAQTAVVYTWEGLTFPKLPSAYTISSDDEILGLNEEHLPRTRPLLAPNAGVSPTGLGVTGSNDGNESVSPSWNRTPSWTIICLSPQPALWQYDIGYLTHPIVNDHLNISRSTTIPFSYHQWPKLKFQHDAKLCAADMFPVSYATLRAVNVRYPVGVLARYMVGVRARLWGLVHDDIQQDSQAWSQLANNLLPQSQVFGTWGSMGPQPQSHVWLPIDTSPPGWGTGSGWGESSDRDSIGWGTGWETGGGWGESSDRASDDNNPWTGWVVGSDGRWVDPELTM